MTVPWHIAYVPKKIESLPIDVFIRTLLRGIFKSCRFRGFSIVFDTFCQCGLVLKCSIVGPRFYFTHEIALNDGYLSQIFSNLKVLGMNETTF